MVPDLWDAAAHSLKYQIEESESTQPRPRGIMEKWRKVHRCTSINKQGKPCGAAATPGGLCFFHANPKQTVELGRLGGRRNGRRASELEPLPDLVSVERVRQANERIIAGVHAGTLHPRVAAVLTQALSLQLRVLEKTALEQQLAETRQELALMREELEKSNRELSEIPK